MVALLLCCRLTESDITVTPSVYFRQTSRNDDMHEYDDEDVEESDYSTLMLAQKYYENCILLIAIHIPQFPNHLLFTANVSPFPGLIQGLFE